MKRVIKDFKIAEQVGFLCKQAELTSMTEAEKSSKRESIWFYADYIHSLNPQKTVPFRKQEWLKSYQIC